MFKYNWESPHLWLTTKPIQNGKTAVRLEKREDNLSTDAQS